MFFACRIVNSVSQSVDVTAMRFTTDDKLSLNGCEWKKIRRKTLAQYVFDRRWSLDGGNQCEIFNIVDLCSGVGIVWLTTTRTWLIDFNAVTFSLKCLNQLKLCPLSGNIFKKQFALYFLFIHEHLINIDFQRQILLL